MLSWAESFNIVQAADETYHDLEFLCNQEEQVVIFFHYSASTGTHHISVGILLEIFIVWFCFTHSLSR